MINFCTEYKLKDRSSHFFTKVNLAFLGKETGSANPLSALFIWNNLSGSYNIYKQTKYDQKDGCRMLIKYQFVKFDIKKCSFERLSDIHQIMKLNRDKI